MSSNIALARAELAALLTPIAPVKTGRAALETTSATLPVITIWDISESPAQAQGFATPQYTRQVTAEYKATASAAYDADMDDVLHRIRAALKPTLGEPVLTHATAIRETAVRFYAPATNEAGASSIASLQISFEIDYLERL
jgi:hypothetical protein